MNTKKLITGIVAIALITGVVGGAYYLTSGFTSTDISEKFKEKQTTSFIVNDVEIESGSTIDLPKNIIIKQTLKESLIDTKASININGGIASTKKLTWKASFVGSDVEANINDFINIETSENSFSAKITILKAFSNQINISVSTNGGVSNNFTLDYYKRYESINNNNITDSNNYNLQDISNSTDLVKALKEYKNNININVVGTIGSCNINTYLSEINTISNFSLNSLLGIESQIDYSTFISGYNNTALSDYLIKYMILNSDVGLSDYTNYINNRLNKCYYESLEEYWSESNGTIVFVFESEITNNDGSIDLKKSYFNFKYGNKQVNELIMSTTDIQF